MNKNLKLNINKELERWMSEYGENITSIQDLYSMRVDCLLNTTTVAEFDNNGNSLKIWADDSCGFVYIEVSDWLSMEISGENIWISDYLSTNTPYRYIKLDTEKKTVTYCALIFTHDEKLIQSTVQECINSLANFQNYRKSVDNCETVYIEDQYIGKVYETNRSKNDAKDFEEDEYDEC